MRKDGMHLNRKLRLYLGTAEFYKRVGIIAIPIALQSLISIGVNMMDTVMLGALGGSSSIGFLPGKPVH